MKLKNAFLILLCTLLISGCGTIKSAAQYFKIKFPLQTIQITSVPDANDTMPTPIHLLIIFDKDLLAELGKLSAAKYFENAQQILNDHPDMLEVHSYEIMPGQVLPEQFVQFRNFPAEGGLLFANLVAPGEHRIKIGNQKKLKLRVQKNKINIAPPLNSKP